MNDASGQAMVQQVTVQHKDMVEDGEKEYTTMNVSTGAPIHLHVVDEDNRTIQVLNVDNQGKKDQYFKDFLAYTNHIYFFTGYVF